MQLTTFVGEVQLWSKAVQAGDMATAERHLTQLYHLGASLVASKEFQGLSMDRWSRPVEQQVLENMRQFLGLVQAASAAEKASNRAVPPIVVAIPNAPSTPSRA